MDAGKHTRDPTRLGAYEIIRPLARGGMAELFVARAVGLEGFEKVVVLKRVLPHFAENPRFVRSFLDEAKLVAGFDHPNIAHVYDMGMADGSYFFTMELVQGVDLRTVLKRCARDHHQLPIALAVLIARNIASALHYAHERRDSEGKLLDVVHRDVSPSNIIVSFSGGPKLIDFGIAKAASSSIKTQTGALKGKISYMSPEQAKGAPIDRRTDIFALGIVLWEMLTCRRLYKSDNDMATIQRIIYERPPSPRKYRPDCPPALEAIVLRALSLDITGRYATAQQLEVDLEELALEHRIKQSSIELNAYMQSTFADELKAANEAQSAPATVTDAHAYTGDATESDSSLGGRAALDADDDSDDLPPAKWSGSKDDDPHGFDVSTPPTTDQRQIESASLEAPQLRRARWPWVAVPGLVAAVVAGGWLWSAAREPTPPAAAPAPPVVESKQPAVEPPQIEHAELRQPEVVPHDAAPADRVASDPVSPPPPAVAKKPAKKPRVIAKKPPRDEAPKREEPKPKETKPYDPNAIFPPSP